MFFLRKERLSSFVYLSNLQYIFPATWNQILWSFKKYKFLHLMPYNGGLYLSVNFNVPTSHLWRRRVSSFFCLFTINCFSNHLKSWNWMSQNWKMDIISYIYITWERFPIFKYQLLPHLFYGHLVTIGTSSAFALHHWTLFL